MRTGQTLSRKPSSSRRSRETEALPSVSLVSWIIGRLILRRRRVLGKKAPGGPCGVVPVSSMPHERRSMGGDNPQQMASDRPRIGRPRGPAKNPSIFPGRGLETPRRNGYPLGRGKEREGSPPIKLGFSFQPFFVACVWCIILFGGNSTLFAY